MQMQPMTGPLPSGLQPQHPQGPATLQQQQQQQQAQLQAQQAQLAQEKMDNVTKVKSLIPSLRETLAVTLKTAAQQLHQNSMVDIGTLKGSDVPLQRYDKNLEEFYSICDVMELNLKTAIECVTQGNSSQRYLSMQVALTRTDPGPPTQQQEALSYPQFIGTSKAQVSYARELHDTLLTAAQALGSSE